MHSIKITSKERPAITIGAVSRVVDAKYNDNGTSSLVVERIVEGVYEDLNVTIKAGEIAYQMNEDGKTVTAYYPTNKGGKQ